MAEMIKKHTYAWTVDGRKVYIDAITDDGQYVVSGLYLQIYGEDSEEEKGETWIHNGPLYLEPPVQVIDADIAAKRQELGRINIEYNSAISRARNAEQEVTRRIEALKKYKGLERLEDFMAGKITHFVAIDYSGANIKTWDELAVYREDDRRHPNGIKLLSLFGDSKGDLMWRIDQYREPTSSHMEVIPCTSLEEAIERRNAHLFSALDSAMLPASPGAYKGEENRRNRVFMAVEAINKADRGLEIPEAALEIARAEWAAMLSRQRTDLLADLDRTQAKLNELENKGAV